MSSPPVIRPKTTRMTPIRENISPIGQRISSPIKRVPFLAENQVQNHTAAQEDDAEGCRAQVPGLFLILELRCEGVVQSVEFIVRLGAPRHQRNHQREDEAGPESN